MGGKLGAIRWASQALKLIEKSQNTTSETQGSYTLLIQRHTLRGFTLHSVYTLLFSFFLSLLHVSLNGLLFFLSLFLRLSVSLSFSLSLNPPPLPFCTISNIWVSLWTDQNNRRAREKKEKRWLKWPNSFNPGNIKKININLVLELQRACVFVSGSQTNQIPSAEWVWSFIIKGRIGFSGQFSFYAEDIWAGVKTFFVGLCEERKNSCM